MRNSVPALSGRRPPLGNQGPLVSHGLSLYAFDGELISTFFHLGFGQRVGDALRSTEPIDAPMPPGLRFVELCPSQRQLISPLARALSAHLGASPCFMPSVNASTHEGTRLFAAFKTEELIAYLEVTDSGETFVDDDPSAQHLCGAYCLPEYRGNGVSSALLNYVLMHLRAEGYTLCGVDYESINPTAMAFWQKFFTPFTVGLTRRIDERILKELQ